MCLVSKVVKVKWGSRNKKYYEKLGYEYTKQGDIFEVKIEDLLKGSSVKVDCVCDNCGANLKPSYKDYKRTVKENGKTYCNDCSVKLYGHNNQIVSRLESSKSFAQKLIKEYGDNALELYWDYEKNSIDPYKIGYGSNEKVWIFCQEKDYHGSYEIRCGDFSNGRRCPFCNGTNTHPLDSLKQYVVENYGEEFFNIIWSNKNTIDPNTIKPNSTIECWWNCPDNKHEPFKRSCNDSYTCEYRCPDCSKERNESMIEEKVRLYLEELGYKVLTEYDTLRVTNPKTNRIMPYDNEIILQNGKHLIIEVHGQQHYFISFWKSKGLTKEESEKELHYRQVKDRYKRIKCIQAGYEYLEIPYYLFDKRIKNDYKEIIDNKIKEILGVDNQ